MAASGEGTSVTGAGLRDREGKSREMGLAGKGSRTHTGGTENKATREAAHGKAWLVHRQ